MVQRVEAAKVDELRNGEMKAVEVGERTVVLANVDGGFFAFDDECTHAGCSLSEGDLEGDTLECICHGSMFNVRTGAVEEGPAEQPIPTYPATIEGKTVYIAVE